MLAALFAWHPLHVESVAWVAERKDVRERFVLHLDDLGLRPLCGRVENAQWKAEVFLLAGAVPFRTGLNGQTDAGNAPVRAAAAGLVAAGRVFKRRRLPARPRRKPPAAREQGPC